jgi:hypothetical protein
MREPVMRIQALCGWLYMVLVLLFVFAQASSGETYFMQGYHGGYYLTDNGDYQQTLQMLFALLSHNPEFKIVLELEPYTLQRMKGGENFDFERFGRDKVTAPGWNLGGQGDFDVAISSTSSRSGTYGLRVFFRSGLYAHACSTVDAARYRGKELIFSGWLRQNKGRGAHLYIDAWDDYALIPGSVRRNRQVQAGSAWQRIELRWRVPENAVRFFPQAKCDTESTDADFDDICLVVAQTGEEILTNGGFENVVDPALQDTETLAQIQEFVRRGQIEIVGGAYTQPILYTIGDESAVRQFVFGTQVVEDTLGVPVRIYAAQEPGMCSQLPQLLTQMSFNGVLYRTPWALFGGPPHRNSEIVWWIGKENSKIQAVPAYAEFPPPRYGLVCYPTPKLLQSLHSVGIQRPLFGPIADLNRQSVPEANSPLLRGEFGQGWANLCWVLPAQALRGEWVNLSCFIRARGPGVHLYIDSHDQDRLVLSNIQSEDVPVDDLWHCVQIRYHVPTAAVTLFPQGRIIGASGEAEFDAFKLTKDDGTIIAQTTFENGNLGDLIAGASEGINVETQILSGDAHEGQKYVVLQMDSPALKGHVVTTDEYFQIMGDPEEQWQDAFDGFEFRFPFGLLSGTVQHADRQSEDLLLQTERLLAIVGADDEGLLNDAWEAHLMGEHHDGWVCAPSIFGIWRQPTYAEMCQTAFREAECCCRNLMHRSGVLLPEEPNTVVVEGIEFAVLNTSAFSRSEVVSVNMLLPKGVIKQPGVALILPSANITMPAQINVLTRHEDGSAKEICVNMLAEVPTTTVRLYRVMESIASDLPEIKIVQGERLQIDNGIVCLQAEKGSVSVGLVNGELLPLILRGYFPGDGHAEVGICATQVIGERGSCSIFGEGQINGVPLKTRFQITPNSPLVSMKLEFDFGEKTDIGAPEGLDAAGFPIHARDDHKLRMALPLTFADPRFFAHAPYEVREVTGDRYPILRYAIAEGEDSGIALFTGRATMCLFYRHQPSLELVLAYGGQYIYAPNQYAPLKGKQEFEFGLMPYHGTWKSAKVPKWSEVFAHPLLIMKPEITPAVSQSLLTLEPEDAAIVTALFFQGEHLVLRLWQPYDGEVEFEAHIAGARNLRITDLRHLLHSVATDSFRMRQHQIMTLCGVPSE